METFITLQPRGTKSAIIINTAHIVAAYMSPGGTAFKLINGAIIQTRYPMSVVEQHLNQIATVCSFTQENATQTGAKNKGRSR